MQPTILDNSDTLMVAVFDVDEQRNLYANRALEQFNGATLRDLQSQGLQTFFHRVHPDDAPTIMQHIRKHLSSLPSNRHRAMVTFRQLNANGEWRLLELTDLVFRRDDSGKVRQTLSIMVDITGYSDDEPTYDIHWLREQLVLQQRTLQTLDNALRQADHEFRTLLALISSSIQFLSRYLDRITVDQRRKRLAGIQQAVLQISDMLQAIRLYLHGFRQTLSVTVEDYPLRMTVQAALEETGQRLGDERIRFNSDIADGVVSQGYPDITRLIVVEVLRNALLYSAGDTLVQVDLSIQQQTSTDGKASDMIVLSVQDEGIGIPEDDLLYIYEPFYRGSNLGYVPGIGLGLSNSRAALQYIGGSIEVESNTEGDQQGTLFTVRWPLLLR